MMVEVERNVFSEKKIVPIQFDLGLDLEFGSLEKSCRISTKSHSELTLMRVLNFEFEATACSEFSKISTFATFA